MQNPNRGENLTPLSDVCHRAKDSDTHDRAVVLRQQLTGEREVRFGEFEYEGHFTEIAERHGWVFETTKK